MINGEFQIETINDEIKIFVLMPGVITMDPQGAYDLAHVLIEDANKLRRKTEPLIRLKGDG